MEEMKAQPAFRPRLWLWIIQGHICKIQTAIMKEWVDGKVKQRGNEAETCKKKIQEWREKTGLQFTLNFIEVEAQPDILTV